MRWKTLISSDRLEKFNSLRTLENTQQRGVHSHHKLGRDSDADFGGKQMGVHSHQKIRSRQWCRFWRKAPYTLEGERQLHHRSRSSLYHIWQKKRFSDQKRLHGDSWNPWTIYRRDEELASTAFKFWSVVNKPLTPSQHLRNIFPRRTGVWRPITLLGTQLLVKATFWYASSKEYSERYQQKFKGFKQNTGFLG